MMDSTLGTDSQDSDDLIPPGITASEYDKTRPIMPKKTLVTTPTFSPGLNTSKGIQNAKKKLRAFSIQKKTPMTAVSVPKPVSTGNATVLIGRLSSVKTTPKPDKEIDPEKKPPKPPKPGSSKKNLQESYTALQKRTLCEIEDMKRKMELVDLGIPLGLICPSSTSDKAMPTKAMPPIKSFLDPAKVDELIREAKKARAAGKEFKFDYQKLLPDYDNPFQRKKDDPNNTEKDKKDDDHHSSYRSERKEEKDRSDRDRDRDRTDRKKRESDKYDKRPFDKPDKRDDRDKDKYRERAEKDKYKSKEKEREKETSKKVEDTKSRKESDVNLGEYVVCDSWSLDNDDKTNSSPKVDKTTKRPEKEKPKEPMEILKENLMKKDSSKVVDSPVNKPKIEKLKPVIDAFKFDIDPNEEEVLEIYDDLPMEKYPKPQISKEVLYDSPIDLKLFEYDQDSSKDVIDANDDNFLESVINEIKQENMSDDTSQDNRAGLVEYDSPKEDDDEFKTSTSQGSVTPEMDDRMRDLQSSQQSHYSDGYRSTESGYKSTESGYKSTESYKSERDYRPNESRHRADSRTDSYRMSVEKEIDSENLNMSRSTVDSLETWSFVLKICQPLLFRHDKNKCYKETLTAPKLWFTANPKWCDCVKDRSVVYEELEMCKMSLVDRVYGCDQIPDAACPTSRAWYPRLGLAEVASAAPIMSTDWESDEPPRSTTPQAADLTLHREYQRFIESVWPDVSDPKPETSRSTTPDRSSRKENRKKKKAEDAEKDAEDRKKAKRAKLSSEGWSQESDLEEEVEKPKKMKSDKEKIRKRKHSTSSESDSEESAKKKKKIKKKDIKKTKAKLAKRRRVNKKIKKKLKEKQKKKKKQAKIEKISIDSDKEEKEKKKEKKLKKKTQLKAKKAQKKKKAKPKSSSSSDSSDSSSDSESELERKKNKKKQLLKKKKDKKKKRKESTDSTQSEELFDVNILNNIKTERLTDDEKNQQMNDFSPRRQKNIIRDREIINVKELQNDFVGNNIHIKQEKDDDGKVSEVREETGQKIASETNKEQKVREEIPIEAVPAPVDIKPKDTENKEQPPQESKTLSPIPLPEESQIPLPQKTEAAKTIKITTISPKEEQPTIHLPLESNIPLPEEIKTQYIPEPPPKLQEKEAKKHTNDQAQSYGYTDVSASQNDLYGKEIEQDIEDKFAENYDQENYEMYEQMAMAYQSDVANQVVSSDRSDAAQRIETVVRTRGRGEIKCDWRCADQPPTAHTATRPSRWGLKPGEVNIVLTGGSDSAESQYPIRSVMEPVYKIQSLANRHDTSNSSIGYDEAYQVTYGASDRLQYGDCFGEPPPAESLGTGAGDKGAERGPGGKGEGPTTSTLDERISRALRETVLGDVAKETDDAEADKDTPDKGILLTGSESRTVSKRVSFADGYAPGQDSDVEEPPIKKRKKTRRYGCAWPCEASHPDHVPLWDALPPPPPPPHSPPPPPMNGPPIHLLRQQRQALLPLPHHSMAKPDPIMSLPPFLPPEPPPGLINFQ